MTWRKCFAVSTIALAAPMASGEGQAENALLIVDPDHPAAMYLANYYRAARDIPDTHVVYMKPGAASYATFVADNLDAFFGYMANTGNRELVDYAIIAPTDAFWMPIPAGLITDGCSQVSRVSLTAAYTLAQIPDKVLAGMPSTRTNQYFRGNNAARGFNSLTTWFSGTPSDSPNAEAYFIGAQLGYTGSLGNTVPELITMIDRSASADGTRPVGTYYYMTTTDPARSGPRDGDYAARVADLIADGASAQNLAGVLPTANDCLGVMTGWASPDITNANMTLVPGAFCDHLTSWAATFDIASQTKVSRWIAKGASGSWGAVQEPCNYPGKFPNPRIHVTYNRGLTLGEAALRAAAFLPFQSMLYGDPLTRPFAYIPTVSVPDAPVGAASGVITLTPIGSNTNPSADIGEFLLVIDGRLMQTIAPGGSFTVDTRLLTDGWHDLRVLVVDDTITRVGGRWTGQLLVNNTNGSVGLTPVGAINGDLSTAFSFNVSAVAPAGQSVTEVRLVHNNRVVAAAAGSAATLSASGLQLGAGPARVFAEAVLGGGRFMRSAPLTLDIAFASGTPSGAIPAARSYRKYVRNDSPAVVELPVQHDNDTVALTWQVLSTPAQATLTGVGSYRILRPDPAASGTDTFTFRVTSSLGTSNTATVTVVYLPCPADVDGDGRVTLSDLLAVLGGFGMTDATREDGDLDGDGMVGLADLLLVLDGFSSGCP